MRPASPMSPGWTTALNLITAIHESILLAMKTAPLALTMKPGKTDPGFSMQYFDSIFPVE